MAEKLKRCQCTVAGHGDRCEVAQEVKDATRDDMSGIRRRKEEAELREALSGCNEQIVTNCICA